MKDYKKDFVLFFNTIKKLNIPKRSIFLILSIMIISNVLSLAFPLFFGNIINGIVSKSFYSIKMNLIYMFLCFVVSTVLDYKNQKMINKLSYSVELNIKEDLFNSILEMPYSRVYKIDKGRLVNNIESDSTIFSSILFDNMNLVVQTISMLISLIFMVYISPILTLVTIVTFPITFMIYIYSGRMMKSKEIEYTKMHDSFMSFLYESLSGLKSIKIFKAENKWNEMFKKNVIDINEKNIEKFNVQLVTQVIIGVVTFLINNLNIILAIYLIFNGRLSLGMMTAFNEYSERFKGVLLLLSRLNSKIQQVSVSLRRVGEIVEYESVGKIENVNDKERYNKIEKIEIKNLSHTTQSSIEVFKDLNINFYKNNIYLIKGASGSGKTSLLNLLSKLFDDYSGEILINDIELKCYSEENLRNKVSYVTQENYMFSISIRENISLYRDVPLEDIENICKRLNLHELIISLPNQYDTVINDEGLNFSGGQIQRVCFARAIVSNPDVYLFDEITSAIDQKNIEDVLRIIEEISANAIVLLATHENFNFNVPIIECNVMNKRIETNGLHLLQNV
ncbi:ABC transporter ATP-binding protein/permease [Paenibacillus motobuensis]|uniref:ABC transporter ATP-binding protein n=1 Tax=Paenibacillus TaxID=44249 RepID=UPI00203BAB9B|nr:MULTISPECIES: ABC transporter ATP-binding protein [Paenibacillus]MCM3042553.1 ABC transporter ATP-binding protein/permease [Paenibacillus lutimineralis]MCM3649657.1 ABC transporter ATP-binding protein/permease [Paenibacillus motobuensis]